MLYYQKHTDIFDMPELTEIKTWQDYMRDQTLEWFGEDNQESFEKKLRNRDQRSQLERNGWMDRTIEYRFNGHGFRGAEHLRDLPHFCVFGDSVTFGAALCESDLYHQVLAQRLGLASYNFGMNGSSDSSAVRLAMTWLPKLSPRFVIWQKTFDHRYELIEDYKHASVYGVNACGGGEPPTTSDNYYRVWVEHDENRRLAAIKNACTMRYLCESLGIPLFEIDINDFFAGEMDYGRDLLHPGPGCHRRIADLLEPDVRLASRA
jgi:hypothetical protein